MLVLSGGRVIDGFGGTPLEDAVVVVRGNRIEAVGRIGAVAIPGDARTINVSGMTLLPGLWESHGHLMHIGEGDPDQFPANYAARAKEVMGAVARTTLLSGITTFRDTGGPLEAAERVKVAKQKLSKFIAAGGREQIVAGTDAGSPLNVHPAVLREIRNLHEAGLTAMEAIHAATLRPAQMQGVLDKLGTVTPGKLADLVVVDGDPLQDLSVIEHRLIRNSSYVGHDAMTSSRLDALVEELRRAYLHKEPTPLGPGRRPALLVVREAVGDRSPLANEANLLDIAARYGDVVSIEQARQFVTGRGG